MKNNLIDRTWISPLVTVTFGVIGITGLLLFFHVKNRPTVTLHEWFGWAFIIAGGVHLLLNWRLLIPYLRCRSAIAALTVCLLAVVGLAIGGALESSPGGGGRPMMPVMTAMDVNGNGILEANEIAQANIALSRLDKNSDGNLTADELQPGRPGMH